MPKLQMFFDYACPYCLRGHEHLMAVLPQFPGVEVEWIACEAHPRPEVHGLYSDLCAQGMYAAMEQGADILKYHELMYKAAIKDRINIESIDALADSVSSLVDVNAFKSVLQAGKHSARVNENNQLTWGTHNFPAVPSFVMNGQKLPAIPGVGVDKDMLVRFLSNNK